MADALKMKSYLVKIKTLTTMKVDAHEMRVSNDGVTFLDHNGMDTVILHASHYNLEYCCEEGLATAVGGRQATQRS